MYFLAINRIEAKADSGKLKETIPAHMKWVKEMIKNGRILQAGKWGETGGMAVLSAESLPEAEKILKEDPLNREELVKTEIHRFFPDVEMEKGEAGV